MNFVFVNVKEFEISNKYREALKIKFKYTFC